MDSNLTLLVILVLSVGAGAVTTVAGMGGGMLLLLALALLGSPSWALAVTAPALLLGNLHRLWLFRRHVHRPTVRAFVVGAVPGALAGGLLMAFAFPPLLARVLMVGLTVLALAGASGRLKFQVPKGVLAPAGLIVGLLTGTSGGAGLLVAPLLLASGLNGAAYIGTASACAAGMHLARIAGYGAGGLIDSTTLAYAALSAAGILAGNSLGKRARRLTEGLRPGLLEYTTLVGCVVVSLLGITR